MTTLKIRLDVKDLYNAPKEFGVVANIYSIPTKERTHKITREERKKLHNIMIPVGTPWEQNPNFYSATLPAGRYFVEAILPSDEVVGEEILVTDSAKPKELRLRASESPREWMSWQHFTGNVVSAEVYERRSMDTINRISVDPESILITTSSPPIENPSSFDKNNEIAGLAQGFFFANNKLIESIHANQLVSFPGWTKLDPPGRLSEKLQYYSPGAVYEILNFDLARFYTIIGSPRFRGDYNQERFDRYYLFTYGQGFPNQFCVFPIPWKLADGSDEHALVEALILRSGHEESEKNGLDQGFRLSVVVQDKIFGSLIGYLGSGRMTAAETIVRHARGMLFEKGNNPLAAAAGAYVLLSNLGSERPTYWHDWIKNLMNRFPWLPDGAILYGKVLLGQSRDPDNLSKARKCFLEGFRRGLPFYSKGVGYLLDGLNRFANDAKRKSETDELVEDALKIVRDLALRTNVRQPFTCIQFD